MNNLFKDLKPIRQISPVVAATLILFACGTRVGNPKKPDQDNQLVKLPVIDADIPENDIDPSASSSLNLVAQDASNTSSVATGVPNGRQSVLSFNELVAKMNEGEIKLDQVYSTSAEGKTITVLVKASTQTRYTYKAALCSEKKPFLSISWADDGSALAATRNIDEMPFAEIRARHKNDGTSFMQEIAWDSKLPVQFSLWQSRVPPQEQTFIKRPDRIIDAFKLRISKEGVADFTGVNDLQYKETDSGEPVDMNDFIADIRVAGQVRPDKKHFYLAHLEGANLVCPQEFDEDNQSKPGWCFGLKRRNVGENDYSILKKTEIDNAWELINDMEIVKEAEMKEVTFGADVTCPE
jgi:hypothetical protein